MWHQPHLGAARSQTQQGRHQAAGLRAVGVRLVFSVVVCRCSDFGCMYLLTYVWLSECKVLAESKLLAGYFSFRSAVGCRIRKDEIAFSDVTPDGRQLASKYTGTDEFLVYKH